MNLNGMGKRATKSNKIINKINFNKIYNFVHEAVKLFQQTEQ